MEPLYEKSKQSIIARSIATKQFRRVVIVLLRLLRFARNDNFFSVFKFRPSVDGTNGENPGYNPLNPPYQGDFMLLPPPDKGAREVKN